MAGIHRGSVLTNMIDIYKKYINIITKLHIHLNKKLFKKTLHTRHVYIWIVPALVTLSGTCTPLKINVFFPKLYFTLGNINLSLSSSIIYLCTCNVVHC